MRKLHIAATAAAMLALLASCNNDILSAAYEGDSTAGRVCLTLNVGVPAASMASMTRAATTDNDLNGVFGVFAFNEDGTLLWMRLSGDTNGTETNLQGGDSYGDYTGSPSITWHEDNPYTETDTPGMIAGRLYIEAEEYTDPISFLVITNIEGLDGSNGDSGDSAGSGDAGEYGASFYGLKLTPGTSTKSDVIDALSAFDFAVTDETDLKYIPMAGEVDIKEGITPGAGGTLSLRRSLAKIVVNFTWDEDYYEKESLMPDEEDDMEGALEDFIKSGERVFIPESVIVTNVGSYATVYSPHTTDSDGNVELCLPEGNDAEGTDKTALTDRKAAIGSPVYDATTNSFSTSVELYVPETANSCEDAYSGGSPTDNPRISVLLYGTFYEREIIDKKYDNTVNSYWYRLDLIPETGTTDEVDRLLRNYRYTFNLKNIYKRGSTTETEVLTQSIPDNYRMDTEGGEATIVIDDDEILSINVDYKAYIEDTNELIYIAVSSTNVEMPRTTGAVTKVKVITNYGEGEYMSDWNIDSSLLPSYDDTDGNEWDIYDTGVAFSFVYDQNAKSLWIYLDHPDLVEVGQMYIYYITAGNIHKKMRITITEGAYEDED